VYIAAGIARPERFVADVISAGWNVVGTSLFRDHYQFTNADVRRIAAAALASRAAIVLTTEKDAVRLESCDLGDVPLASVPLLTAIEPAEAFRDWLLERVRSRRPPHRPADAAGSTLHPE
jgi:tetraacyldisaccharide 4'-kinase